MWEAITLINIHMMGSQDEEERQDGEEEYLKKKWAKYSQNC